MKEMMVKIRWMRIIKIIKVQSLKITHQLLRMIMMIRMKKKMMIMMMKLILK